MILRSVLSVAAMCPALVLPVSAPAFAEARIGVAVIVTNDVAQLLGQKAAPIAGGEAVVRDEIVRTGEASNARLVFTDDTNLAVGPASTVKLDRFVFADAASYDQAGLELAKGAFRFTTGHSEKKAYDIRTPVATIGVRGTVLDVLSQGGKTTVVLQEGAASVCTRRKGHAVSGARGCVDLLNPGDTAVVTAGGAARSPPGWNFAGNCAGGLCNVTTFAALAQPAVFTDAALCGR